MINYGHGRWGMQVLLLSRGSVVPKAMCWSIPCTVATILLHVFWNTEKGEANVELEGLEAVWSSFTFIFGFLIVFRSNQAYSRFWESVTLFHQVRGEWMSAFSNLLAFCNTDPAKSVEVAHFKFALMRLMSLLHCNALQTTSDLTNDSLEILDVGGFCTKSLMHLKHSPDRTETVLLWIERLVLDADKQKTLDVPAPILSRAFQELSRGMVSATNLRKIRDVPFPFPYSQFLSLMLLAEWMLTPVVASQVILKPWWAGIIVFIISTAVWTLFYTAQEIDQPFGDDANDLPVAAMQREFNEKLEYFCQSMASKVPEITMDSGWHLFMLDSGFGDVDYLIAEAETKGDVSAEGMISRNMGASSRLTQAQIWRKPNDGGEERGPTLAAAPTTEMISVASPVSSPASPSPLRNSLPLSHLSRTTQRQLWQDRPCELPQATKMSLPTEAALAALPSSFSSFIPADERPPELHSASRHSPGQASEEKEEVEEAVVLHLLPRLLPHLPGLEATALTALLERLGVSVVRSPARPAPGHPREVLVKLAARLRDSSDTLQGGEVDAELPKKISVLILALEEMSEATPSTEDVRAL